MARATLLLPTKPTNQAKTKHTNVYWTDIGTTTMMKRMTTLRGCGSCCLLLTVLSVLSLVPTDKLAVSALSTVILGTPRELQLGVAKSCARQEIGTAFICPEQSQQGNRILMYGGDYGKAGVDEPGKAKPISSGDDIQEALNVADSLVFLTYDGSVEASTVKTLLENANTDTLKRVVLLSKQGVTKAKGGFFGGGADAKILDTEKAIRELCGSKGLEVCVIRAGVLKGGGPGDDGNDFGLNKAYYNTLIESLEASVTMAMDRFTLGLDCYKGDSVEQSSTFARFGSRSSFDGAPDDTNRAVAAEAVAAVLKVTDSIDGLEFSIGSKSGKELPTPEEWSAAIESMR